MSNGAGEGRESRRIVDIAFELARELSIGTLLVHAEDGRDTRLFATRRRDERLIWLVRARRQSELPPPEGRDIHLQVPDVALTRVSPAGIGLFLSVLHGHVGLDETVICLSGMVGGKRLDTLILTNARRDFPWLDDPRLASEFPAIVSKELARILDIALRLAAEGREGRSIGTIFVIGEPDDLEAHTRQMILNPCAGHPKRKRSVHDPEFFETLRELAAIDGAFVVDPRGVVHSAGTYLDAPTRDLTLAEGLGARHAAAAAITRVTTCTSVAVSESSGAVTVFHGGRTILRLERA